MSTPQSVISSYPSQRRAQVQALLSLNSQLRSAKTTLTSLISSGAASDAIATQQALVDSLQSQIDSAKSTVRSLNAAKNAAVAQVVASSGVTLITATATAAPKLFNGPTGPVGPTGPSYSVVVDSAPSATGTTRAVTSGGVNSALSSAVAAIGGITVGTVLPGSGTTGQLWTNGTDLYMYTSSATWLRAQSA